MLDICYLPYLPENSILDLMHIVYTLFMWFFIGIISFYVATSQAFGQTSGMFIFPKIIWIDTIMLLFLINKRFMKIKIEYMDAQRHTLYNMSSFILHLNTLNWTKFIHQSMKTKCDEAQTLCNKINSLQWNILDIKPLAHCYRISTPPYLPIWTNYMF